MNGDVVGVYCPPDSDHEEEYFWLFNIKRASSSRAFGHWYNIQGKGIYKKGDADSIYLRNIIRPAKKLENFFIIKLHQNDCYFHLDDTSHVFLRDHVKQVLFNG